jgi:hypothetical protein
VSYLVSPRRGSGQLFTLTLGWRPGAHGNAAAAWLAGHQHRTFVISPSGDFSHGGKPRGVARFP